jgi:hypothetical protein
MSRSAPELRAAFADAVHDLAADPSSANVVRYLTASRNLEESSEVATPKPKRRRRAVRLSEAV